MLGKRRITSITLTGDLPFFHFMSLQEILSDYSIALWSYMSVEAFVHETYLDLLYSHSKVNTKCELKSKELWRVSEFDFGS